MNEQCIEWNGGRCGKYPKIPRSLQRSGFRLAHRWAFERFYGPVPQGLFVLHNCDNPKCINPLHLRAGTAADNMRDCVSRQRHPKLQVTHCPQGHPYSPDNLLKKYRRGSTWRSCKQCHAARERERYRALEMRRASL